MADSEKLTSPFLAELRRACQNVAGIRREIRKRSSHLGHAKLYEADFVT